MSAQNSDPGQSPRERRLDLRVIGSEATAKEFLELLTIGGFDVTQSGTRPARRGKSVMAYARVRWSR